MNSSLNQYMGHLAAFLVIAAIVGGLALIRWFRDR